MLHGVEKHDARALHRTRVASRRLRELLPVLQLDAKVARTLGRRLRKLTARLGPLRELDVTLQLIDELGDSERYDSDAVDQIRAETAEARDAALNRLPGKWPTREIRRLGSKLADLAERLESRETGSARASTAARGLRWAVEARIHRRAGALRGAIESAGSVYLPDRLHVVRISMKKFRYALELAADMAGDRGLSPQLRLLKRNQDLLGRWHDRQVLIDHIRQAQASLAPPALDAWRRLDGLVMALEEDCRRLHARYVREAAALVGVCGHVNGRTMAASRAS
jgi:CHAD domain-containing protein